VRCNDRLRERLSEEATAVGCQCQVSDRKFSTDNAAMIAFAAAKRHQAGIAPDSLHADIDPNWKLG